MPPSKRVVLNTEACGGCLTCELVCSGRHFDGECHKNLSAIRIDADMLDYSFSLSVCRQCKSASCVAACRLGAMKFDENTNARYIDKEKCVNCGLCVKACPFANEKMSPIKRVMFHGKPKVIKCDLCRGYEGGPLCVAICPKAALSVQ
ncbi:4Fe-4S dicluster domain-containing protein [Sporomusa silvacetica]